MKILPVNLFTTSPRQSNQIVPYNKQQSYQDTFVRSEKPKSIAFTGNDDNQNYFQKVMQNPTLVKQVMDLVTTAATIFVAKAADNNNSQNESFDLQNIFSNPQPQNDEQKKEDETEALKKQLKEQRKEIELLKKLLARKEQESIVDTNIRTEDAPIIELHEDNFATQDKQEENSSFVFPKKRVGVLSKAQKELKDTTTKLKLDNNSGEKLTAICKELLTNNTHNIDGKTVDNKELIIDLNKKLKDTQTNNPEEIIDEFYKKCGFVDEVENEDIQSAPLNQNSDGNNNSKSQENPQAEIFQTEKVVLPGVTVKGKINLDEIKGSKKPTENTTNTTSTQKPKRPRIVKSNPQTDFKTTSALEITDKKTKTSIFKIPAGLIDKDVMVNLTRLLYKYEDMMEQDDPSVKYQTHQSLGIKISEAAIINELKHQVDGPFMHINKSNVSEVEKAINSDPRFNEMFTLHAAMRLIDRFADFDSDTPLEDQCSYILDKLTDVLQKSFKEGLEVRRYKDKHSKVGLRLFISEDIYSAEEKKIFGSYPFKLGICENQPDTNYYNKHNKKPLICTIFTTGI